MPGATPYALSVLRCIPIALQELVQAELSKLEEQSAVCRVDEPTLWYTGLEVVPKQARGYTFCINLTKLNQTVLREHHAFATVDQVLALLGVAKVLSKLGAC